MRPDCIGVLTNLAPEWCGSDFKNIKFISTLCEIVMRV